MLASKILTHGVQSEESWERDYYRIMAILRGKYKTIDPWEILRRKIIVLTTKHASHKGVLYQTNKIIDIYTVTYTIIYIIYYCQVYSYMLVCIVLT